MFRDFVFFDTFRSQLRDFLQANRIRTDLTDEDVHWNEFVTQYAGVIEDGSLSIRAENHGIRQVKQVTFTKDQCEDGRIRSNTLRHDLGRHASQWAERHG